MILATKPIWSPSWRIKSRNGTLSLSLPSFDLESADGCGRDFLQVKPFLYSSEYMFKPYLNHIQVKPFLYSLEYISKPYLKVDGPVKDHGKTELCGNNVSFSFSFFIFIQLSQVSVSGARRHFVWVQVSYFDHQVCIQWQQKKVWIQSKNYRKLIWIIESNFKGLFKRLCCITIPDCGSMPMIYGCSSSKPN